MIQKTIVKGFITRHVPEDEWISYVEEYHEDELVNSDAIPYYIEGPDGKLYETYKRPENAVVYIECFPLP